MAVNRANSIDYIIKKSANQSSDICIFISHISIEKKKAEEIGKYIIEAGYDIYLDINDEILQQAVVKNDASKITSCIEKGLNTSSHLLCLISDDTKNSWWVPYEIGYSKKCNNAISSLTLKGVSNIPEYLKVNPMYKGTTGIDSYLSSLTSNGFIKYGYTTKSLNINKSYYHPLSTYLD